MRELGYFPPYALARILLAVLRNPRAGVRMAAAYLSSPYRVYDGEVASWLRRRQARALLRALAGARPLLAEPL